MNISILNKSKNIAMLLLSILIAGCSSVQHLTGTSSDSAIKDVAVLTDYELKDGFITIQAVGYGCTFFNSFKVEVADKQENSLEVVRTRPDNCRMKPRNVSLQYSYKHLGLDLNRFVEVKNPVSITHTSNTAAN
ncbi:hypothetical protein [Aliikangiella sp. IMCC44632]